MMSVLRLWKNKPKGPPGPPALPLPRHTSAEALSDLCLVITMVTAVHQRRNPMFYEERLDDPGSHLNQVLLDLPGLPEALPAPSSHFLWLGCIII